MATYGLFLNDLPCLLDHRGQVQHDILDKYLPLEWVHGERWGAREKILPGVPNYESPPVLRVNQAFFPVGATTWGYGYLLFELENIQDIEAGPATLSAKVDETGEHRSLLTTVHVTRVIPLNRQKPLADPAPDSGLYLVAFVDSRWTWQSLAVDLVADDFDTWEALLDKIIAAAPSDTILYTPSEIQQNYLKPARNWFIRQEVNNVGALLDMCCHSLGLRCVRDWDGTYLLTNAATAETRFTTNVPATKPDHLLIGGENNNRTKGYPAKVKVDFRRARDQMAECDFWIPYSSENPTDGEYGEHEAIRSAAWANITGQSEPDPENKTELDNLAAQITADYQAYRQRQFDIAFTGLPPWEPTGYDFGIMFNFGTEFDPVLDVNMPNNVDPPTLTRSYERLLTARVWSQPSNFVANIQLSRSVSVVEDFAPVICRMLTDMLPGETAQRAKLVAYDKIAGGYVDGPDVYLDDYWKTNSDGLIGSVCSLIGEMVYARTQPDDLWLVHDQGTNAYTCYVSTMTSVGLLRRATPVGTITPQAIGLAAITREAGQAPGPQISVKNILAEDMTNQLTYWVAYHEHDGIWRPLSGPTGGAGPPQEQIFMVESDPQAWQPTGVGGTGPGILWQWNSAIGAYQTTGASVTLSDPHEQNYIMPDERVMCVLKVHPVDGQGNINRYEILGSHGLRRKAEYTDQTRLSVGGAGNFQLQHPRMGANPIISVSATNDHSSRRTLEPNDLVWLQWDTLDDVWYVVEDAAPSVGEAIVGPLGQNYTCGGSDPVPIINLFVRDRWNTLSQNIAHPLPTEVLNPHSIPVRDGDGVSVQKDNVNGQWVIVEANHYQKKMVTEVSGGDCGLLANSVLINIPDCNNPPIAELIDLGTLVNVLTGFGISHDDQQNTCDLVLSSATLCVMAVRAVLPPSTITLSREKVVENVYDASDGLYQDIKYLYSLCQDGGTNEQILPYTDCPEPPPDNTQGPN